MNEIEQRVTEALTEFGGPPEIAAQLVAIAQRLEIEPELLDWIRFHRIPEWTCQDFEQWGVRLRHSKEQLDQLRSEAK